MAEVYPIPTDPRFQNLTGKRFGRLVVLAYLGKTKSKSSSLWRCRCDCGKMTRSAGNKLRGNHTRSCGCLSRSRLPVFNKTHGFAGDKRPPEYNIWRAMRERCRNPKIKNYGRYGGRGIKVCKRWDSFACFIADVGWRPSNNHSLERIDNNKGYKPGNVTWATRTEQGRNKRNNHLVTYNGITLCISAWAERLGLAVKTFHSRLTRSTMPLSIAFTPNLLRRRKQSVL